MKRFFDWLLTIFRPDKRNYVKNIQDGNSDPVTPGTYAGNRRKHYSSSLLAWSPSSRLSGIEKDQQGVIEKIGMKKDSAFQALLLSAAPSVESRKKGLSAVAHTLEFSIKPEDNSAAELLKLAQSGASVSFVYRSVYGDSILLGEKKGLLLTNEENGKLTFSGEETDVFFHISEECLNELLPNIEK